jgi:energy-coupling factor transporter ATP-binding protein EcfA2
LLPFESLSWENFERLGHRLISLEGDVEYCARYGSQGDAQEGIDIFARLADGRYHCVQAKRHRLFGAAKLRKAVDTFLAGDWAVRASHFTIMVQAPLRSIKVQEAVEKLAERLSKLGIVFVAIGGPDLTDRIRPYPTLIDDFFGRIWVGALLGQEAADRLGTRLDGGAFARVRSQLARVYEAQFQFVDPGSFVSIAEDDNRPALSLLERFLAPDILIREKVRISGRSDASLSEEKSIQTGDVVDVNQPKAAKAGEVALNTRTRRISLAEWFAGEQRLVVLGEAGCGKSTLLRVIALDLLHSQANFPELAKRWAEHIPVYVPFARWSSLVGMHGGSVGLKDVVRRSLEPLLTESIADLLDQAVDEKRVLLLIDGLDEWSSEQAARATLSALVTTVEAHDLPAIVSGRPRGLSRIGAVPASWRRGTVAPLSTSQQSLIARRWFGRYAATSNDGNGPSDAVFRCDRFMAELARDSNLGALATLPLLLIGLITLALRGQILPRTRGEIYDQLVRILLEVHPNNRATASGDTESRFRHATDPDQRRAAIARLAFFVREHAGGADVSVKEARDVLRAYLASEGVFDLSPTHATSAANEILSVNAETQGLIVEKSPGEIGFVHASFEEYLCAEHLGGWPFTLIENFVRSQAGNSRWRNVISNLLSYIQRRDEFDRLVSVIEDQEPDDLSRYHREALLGDIAFGATTRGSTTTRRLALATMERVETGDWLPARREALASVLRGLSDPVLSADIGARLARWIPGRLSYRSGLISALGEWGPSENLQRLLLQAMHDEDQGVQRSAAAAYAHAFSACDDAYIRLADLLRSTRDLAAAPALLESIALGWPNATGAPELFKEAYESHEGELRLVGILGLVVLGKATNEMRDAVVRGQSFWSNISHQYRELAVAMLMKYWPDDEELIEGALAVFRGARPSIWEHQTAVCYLLESSVDRANVCAWILSELQGDHPFNISGAKRSWSQVGRFALAHPNIRAAANAYWCEPKHRLISLYNLPPYVTKCADPEIALVLIEMAKNKAEHFNRHWALVSLLAGWGRNHPATKSAIDDLAAFADEDLEDLTALIPDIEATKVIARERLIRMAKRPAVRRDLLAVGFQACGSGSADNEAVQAILSDPKKGSKAFDPSPQLFRSFPQHPDVRKLANGVLLELNGPLASIASGYPDDPAFLSPLFDAAVPLPIDLRSQVVEVAGLGASGTVLESILAQGMSEHDPDLRARMVMAHYAALPAEKHLEARAELLKEATATGPDFESVRASALAGLTVINALDELARLQDHGKPVALETGGYSARIASVERLICERFADFQEAFGADLAERFRTFASDNRIADILTSAPGASPASRAAFLALAEREDFSVTARSLRALAAERPRSDLLRARCLEALSQTNHRNDQAMENAVVAHILSEQFPQDEDLRRRLAEQYKMAPVMPNALPLAIYDPNCAELDALTSSSSLGHEFGDWAVAIQISSRRHGTEAFARLVEAMVCRPWASIFDVQQTINLAVADRLQRDSELETLMAKRIADGVHPSVVGSFARYLAAAGKFSPELREKALALIRSHRASQRIPVAGYDAVGDERRVLRATLLDAVSAGLDAS